ncbi:MAG: DUF4835 family protein [Cyclobacteriaceae bacterium]|nr:DUF4835 family protein [Cyclobacteriaceae bacterium]
MLRVIAISALMLVSLNLQINAQELNCRVVVDGTRAQTQERQIFPIMENEFTRFLNERKWTSDNYEVNEKINCNILITIEQMPSIGVFTATAQVQSSRPVYNTNYDTRILNFADRDWQFEYIESQPLEFTDNAFQSNLTSMLAFYAYAILGMDYDSFSELGGTPYFNKCLEIVNLAQTSNMPGWQQFDSNRNRYWLTQNLLDNQMEDLRKGIYRYHRHGLDLFLEKPEDARKEVLDLLKNIRSINKLRPNSIAIISFLDAKADEIINIFKQGDMSVRREAFTILSEVNPPNTEKYRAIIGN